MTIAVRIIGNAIGLFPTGPGFDDPRDQDKPLILLNAESADELSHQLAVAAVELRAAKFDREK